MIDFALFETERTQIATAIVLNTFGSLERQVLDALSSHLSPPVYATGPLHQPLNRTVNTNDLEKKQFESIGSNLWKEDPKCLEWLDSKQLNSIVYVNFGSIIVMTSEQLIEFAWGLTNSKKAFLWIITPDLLSGESTILSPEFTEETKDRGSLASWCLQEQALSHPAVGGFLTHCRWNMTDESICGGDSMLCWPFFAEQQKKTAGSVVKSEGMGWR